MGEKIGAYRSVCEHFFAHEISQDPPNMTVLIAFKAVDGFNPPPLFTTRTMPV
jgi:hypothetical protein